MRSNNGLSPRAGLSIVWIFLTVNYIFCDVFTLMYAEELRQILSGEVGGVKLDQHFLLFSALIMEIPMLMIVLSRVLRYRINRILNLLFPILLIAFQAASLFVGVPTLHYIFFSVIEIAANLVIIGMAWNWKDPT